MFDHIFHLFGPGVIHHPIEDLKATGEIETTIEDLDMDAKNWVEQAARKTGAVKGNTYVKLDHGVLTVDQINAFLNSMPMELTFADSNNQFLYYNYHLKKEDMLADRHPNQVGNSLSECHPKYAIGHVDYVIQELRHNEIDTYQINAPNEDPSKYVVHNYTSVKDDEGNFLGVNEYVHDIKPLIEWYLKETGQRLVQNEDVDAVSSASQSN